MRVLLVATAGVSPNAAGRLIGERFGEDADVRIVAPVSNLSRLAWLANDEDRQRLQAEYRAADLARAIPGEPVEVGVGDTDPVQAIDDALKTFDADQIVVVTGGDEDVSWLEDGAAESARERFDVPITHLRLPA
jgi:hypothetical protein